MIDFAIFCDIQNKIDSRQRAVKRRDHCIFTMLQEEQGDESAITALINNCDRETVKRLMEYFDRKAPIQHILRARLEELRENDKDVVLDEYIRLNKKKSVSFYQYLTKVMEQKGFETDADFYNHIGMSRQTFAKLRKKENTVSRSHALLMAAGLKLNYNEAVDFMKNAGYVFKSADTREAIIAYVMRNKKYDLDSLEEILIAFGEKPLRDNQ